MPAPVVRTNQDELKQVGAQFGQEADAACKILQSLRQHKDAKANGGRWFETAPGQSDVLKGQRLRTAGPISRRPLAGAPARSAAR